MTCCRIRRARSANIATHNADASAISDDGVAMMESSSARHDPLAKTGDYRELTPGQVLIDIAEKEFNLTQLEIPERYRDAVMQELSEGARHPVPLRTQRTTVERLSERPAVGAEVHNGTHIR